MSANGAIFITPTVQQKGIQSGWIRREGIDAMWGVEESYRKWETDAVVGVRKLYRGGHVGGFRTSKGDGNRSSGGGLESKGERE